MSQILGNIYHDNNPKDRVGMTRVRGKMFKYKKIKKLSFSMERGKRMQKRKNWLKGTKATINIVKLDIDGSKTIMGK